MVASIYFDSDNATGVAAAELKGLGNAAIRLLSECVETQGLKRTSVSRTAEALESAGFLSIRGTQVFNGDELELAPTLAGEEALDYLERQETRR